jgi:hypothetical protein
MYARQHAEAEDWACVMSVHSTARTLGISEPELFVRAHRALGGNDRAALERVLRCYEDAGQVPE